MAKRFKPINFGRYLLQQRIAIGGMAEIFNAKIFGAMGFEKQMVIKRILPQFAADAEFLRMFITEAKLVCHLEHPNIVQVHELGEIEGQYYISMEYVNGIDGRQLWRTLAKRKQRLPGVLALFVVAEFLKGLDYAHRAVGPDNRLLGVVHRDVSPSNILISFRGDVKIGDFGIALVQQESKTQAGVLKGKYGYMSPEQVAGLTVDHRSDIFASGIVLAELLLGRRLFLGRSDFETLDKVMNVRLDVLEQHESALPPEVVRIVRLALQREPGERYQSAREFQDDITEFLFQRGERVTQETLAAFIAQHVAPFLTKREGLGTATDKKSGSQAAAMQSPMLPKGIVPRDLEVTPPPVEPDQRPRPPAEPEAKPAAAKPEKRPPPVPVEQEPPPASTEQPRHATDGAGLELELDLGTASSVEAPKPAPAAPEPAPAAPEPAPPAASPTPVGEAELTLDAGGADRAAAGEAQPQPPLPLWDNVIDVDYQFGAIPQLDLDEEGLSGGYDPGELDIDGFVEPNWSQAQSAASAGAIEAPGTELDLDAGDEDAPGLAMRTPPPVVEEPKVMVSAQLATAHEVRSHDAPDFSGKLSHRTVAKVLFRFSLVDETGLLTLTGPEASGVHREQLEWICELQRQAGSRSNGASYEHRTCEIRLEEGHPRLVSADRSEEALVAYLLRTKILNREAVDQAVRNNPHRSLVAAILAAGNITPLGISRHVTAFVLDNVLDTFSWHDGNFAFYRARGVSDEAFPTGLAVLELISKGVETLTEADLDAYLERYRGRRLLPAKAPPRPLDDFKPGELMLGMHRALGRGYSAHDTLAACANLGPLIELKRTLYKLIECELADLA